jgi:hypothetical protein
MNSPHPYQSPESMPERNGGTGFGPFIAFKFLVAGVGWVVAGLFERLFGTLVFGVLVRYGQHCVFALSPPG